MGVKFLVVLALFAAAAAEPEAEADPWYYYSGYAGYHHPYTYGYGYPYHHYVLPAVKPVEEKKVEEEVVEAKETKPVVYTHPYLYNYPYHTAAYTYPYAYHYAKPYTYPPTVAEPFMLSRSGKPKLRPILMPGMDTVDITTHMPTTMDVHTDITEDTGTDMVDIHTTATVITTENKFTFIHQIQYRAKEDRKRIHHKSSKTAEIFANYI